MKIGIIIPSFNRKTYLFALLSSVRKLKLPEGVSIFTIVVVDGSTDGTVEMLNTEFTDFFVVLGDGNWWWTKSINKGIEHARKLDLDHLLFMNDDNILQTDYLEKLLDAKSKLSPNTVLGSASISLSKAGLIDTAGYYKMNSFSFKMYPYKRKGSLVDKNFTGIHETIALSGRGTLVPMNVFNQIGFLDERLVQYGSDDDFILRCKKENIPVFISWDAQVYNHSEITSGERNLTKTSFSDLLGAYFNQYSSLSLKKEFLLYWKHGYSVFAPLYCLYLFVTGIILHYKRKYFF